MHFLRFAPSDSETLGSPGPGVSTRIRNLRGRAPGPFTPTRQTCSTNALPRLKWRRSIDPPLSDLLQGHWGQLLLAIVGAWLEDSRPHPIPTHSGYNGSMSGCREQIGKDRRLVNAAWKWVKRRYSKWRRRQEKRDP